MSKEFRLLEPRRQASLRRKAYGRWLTEAGGVAVEFYRIPPGFLVRFCGTADFTISKSDWSVSCYPAPGRYSASFDDLYLNQVGTSNNPVI